MNQKLQTLPRRYKLEWGIVMVLLALALIWMIGEAVRNFSVEPDAVAQIASLPILLMPVILWGVWQVRRWACWFMLVYIIFTQCIEYHASVWGTDQSLAGYFH